MMFEVEPAFGGHALPPPAPGCCHCARRMLPPVPLVSGCWVATACQAMPQLHLAAAVTRARPEACTCPPRSLGYCNKISTRINVYSNTKRIRLRGMLLSTNKMSDADASGGWAIHQVRAVAKEVHSENGGESSLAGEGWQWRDVRSTVEQGATQKLTCRDSGRS